jgi:membrane protease subunit HflC
MNAQQTTNISGTDDDNTAGWGRWLLRRTLLLLLAIVVMAVLGSSVIFIDESEFVIVERFGKIRDDGKGVYDRPEDRGLHFKWPWPIETVRRFDRRLQIFDPPAREIHTKKKRNIVVDAYICWRIAGSASGSTALADDRPVVRFFRALGDVDRAEARLDTRVRSILPAEIGKVTLAGLLDVADSESGPNPGEPGQLEQVSQAIHNLVIRQPGEELTLLERFGIEVVDVRIKRINLPSGNRQSVYDRMRSERKKEMNKERDEGLAQKQVIEGHAKRQYEAILARARADAERIRGDGEATALETLNAAYAQNREFYRVMRTLESYRKILNERTTLVLSTSSNLMKLLTEGVPETPVNAPAPMKPSGPGKTDTPNTGVSGAATPSAKPANNSVKSPAAEPPGGTP